jgi:SpoVK/Ycf46/Vps4 family AAA+-type ATPase
MSEGIIKEIIRQTSELYTIAESSDSGDDILNSLVVWSLVEKNLELLSALKLPNIKLGGKQKSLDVFANRVSRKILTLKKDVSSRYIPEGDTDALCKNFVPVEFNEGSSECVWWFSTLVGLETEKREIRNGLINPLKFPRLYGKITKGILLYGPGGVGKTAVVKAAINQMTEESGGRLKVLFYAPTAAQLKGKYFGESEKMITAMFECASKNACKIQAEHPELEVISVIFLDEMDSVAGNRSDDKFMATTVNALLQVMDGVKEYQNVTLIGATNLPWNLDSAILRRFSSSIYVQLPKADDIYDLFSLELTKHISNIVSSSDTKKLAIFCKRMLGKSSADGGVVSTKPCSKPEEYVELWSRPPFTALMRNIDPLKLRSLAVICAKQLYSNSDITRLFKNVVQRVADQAVHNNTFISYGSNAFPGGKKYVSTLSFYPMELYKEYSSSGGKDKFRFISPPERLNITLGKDTFHNQSIKPFFNISDPRILEVFIGDVKLDKKGQNIESYEYVVSLNVQIQQEEPENYSSLKEDNEKNYQAIKEKLDASSGKNMENISKWSYSRIYSLLGPELMEKLEKLIIPGLVRTENYFVRGKVGTTEGVVKSSTTFLSQGWRYLSGSIKDWKKVSIEEKEQYIQSLGVLKNIAQNSDAIFSTWYAKEGSIKYVETGGKDISTQMGQRIYKTTSPIFSVSIFDIVASAVINEVDEYVKVSSSDISKETTSVAITPFDSLSFYYYSIGKSFPSYFQALRSKNPEKYTTLVRELGGVDAPDFSQIGLGPEELQQLGLPQETSRQIFDEITSIYGSYTLFKKEMEDVERNVISLNISSEHFVQAQKDVKASTKKEEIENLNRYAQDPSGFVMDKKKV